MNAADDASGADDGVADRDSAAVAGESRVSDPNEPVTAADAAATDSVEAGTDAAGTDAADTDAADTDAADTDAADTDAADTVEAGAGQTDASDDLGTGRSSIKRNIAHMLSSQVVTWSLALILAVVQPRLLGPATTGRLRLGFSLWTIAAVIIALGTTLYLNLQVARRGRAALDLMGPIMVLRLIGWSVACVVFGVGAVVGGADSEFLWIMALYAVAFGLATVFEVYMAVFIGLERMAAPALINVIARFLTTAGSVVVLLAGGRAIAVVAVLVVGNVIALVLLVRALRGVVRVPLHVGRSQWTTILRGSFAFLVAAAILVLYRQIDTVVIALVVDDEALGWYATADVLFGTLLFVPTILSSTIFPTLGRLHEHDQAGLESLVRRTFATLALLAVPIGIGTIVVAERAVDLLYGDAFAETGPVLAVFGVVLIVTAGTILLGTVAMATKQQRFWNSVMFAGVVLTVPLDLVFVPWADRNFDNGAIGGAMAFVVTEVMMLVMGLWRVAPFLLNRRTMSRVARILFAGALLLLATWPTRQGSVLLTAVVGAVVYPVAIFAMRVPSDEELAMLRRVSSRVLPAGVSKRIGN